MFKIIKIKDSSAETPPTSWSVHWLQGGTLFILVDLFGMWYRMLKRSVLPPLYVLVYIVRRYTKTNPGIMEWGVKTLAVLVFVEEILNSFNHFLNIVSQLLLHKKVCYSRPCRSKWCPFYKIFHNFCNLPWHQIYRSWTRRRHDGTTTNLFSRSTCNCYLITSRECRVLLHECWNSSEML